jgi:signal peptidase II
VQAAGGTPLSAQTPDPPRRVRLLLGVAALVIVTDATTKAIAVSHIREYTDIHLIGSLLMLTLTRNGGAAFNLGGTGMTIVFTAIAASVVAYILRASRNLGSTSWAITLGLLLGGATGNLIDRIFRAPGFLRGDVVDWIQLPHWPVFNVADSCIVCAGVLVVLLTMRGIRLDGTRVGRDPNPPAPTPASNQVPTPASNQVPTPASNQVPTPASNQVPTPVSNQAPAPTQAPTPGQTSTSTPSQTPTSAPTRRQTQTPDTPESDYPKLEYPEPQSSAAKSHDGP